MKPFKNYLGFWIPNVNQPYNADGSPCRAFNTEEECQKYIDSL